MTSMISSTSSKVFSEDQLNAQFSAHFYARIQVGKYRGVNESAEFTRYIESDSLRIVGGDEGTSDNNEWLSSVTKDQNLKVTSTRLSFVGDLMSPPERGNVAKLVFEKLLSDCPQNSDGICGGYGLCDFQRATCSCQRGRTGNSCERHDCAYVDCSGHGTCNSATGRCECSENWMGPSCTLQCGTLSVELPKLDGQYIGAGEIHWGACACHALWTEDSVVDSSSRSQSGDVQTISCSTRTTLCTPRFGCSYISRLVCHHTQYPVCTKNT